MSITNIINNENVTLVQGVNGICLCKESWIAQRRTDSSEMLFYADVPADMGEEEA